MACVERSCACLDGVAIEIGQIAGFGIFLILPTCISCCGCVIHRASCYWFEAIFLSTGQKSGHCLVGVYYVANVVLGDSQSSRSTD